MNLLTREYGFFALGLIAAVWFFVGYPSQDPRTVINLSQDKQEVRQKAEQQFEDWGYPEQNFKKIITYRSNHSLLDSLQKKLGRSDFVKQFRSRQVPNIKPFYWSVVFSPTSSESDKIVISAGSDSESQEGPPRDEHIILHLDKDGKVIEFLNPSGIMPLQSMNRSALAAVFETSRDSIKALLSSYPDSVILDEFVIDLQQNTQSPGNTTGRPAFLKEKINKGQKYLLSRRDIFEMASYYLENTGWDLSAFEPDTIRLNRVNGTNAASAVYAMKEASMEQQLKLEVGLTAAGGLVHIDANYNPDAVKSDSNTDLWRLFQNIFIFLFALGGIILFFFRIRSRAIDTQPALIVSILCGLAVSTLVVLFVLSLNDFVLSDGDWTRNMMVFVGAGIAGALASLAFFIFFAIGDSITRQYWPQKLEMYDYIRQGMLFNKPVGLMLVRSVLLGFILAGLWTLLLWIFPHLYMSFENIFTHERAAWPPLHLVLNDGLYAFGVVLAIFLVLGGQVQGYWKNKTVTSSILVLACGIIVPMTGNYGPVLQQFIVSLVIGLGLVLIYLRWDFLTLFFSYFMFLGLMDTVSGWIVTNSMDGYIFIMLMVLMGGFLVGGFLAIAKGKEQKVLSRYVPPYVEELAQEQRIKQELQIAREVQQSFLPAQTPEFEHFELAGICKPAYETGGDYYDFMQLDDKRVAVAIGDVSGKGIQAAFYMTFIKGILHSLCREIDSPAEILKKTNRLFCDNAQRGTFISLVYGIIDLEEQTFRFARAGHNPIIRMNAGDDKVDELQPNGIGLGLTKSKAFDDNIEELELNLAQEDVLVLYTDGIVEALNEAHVFYGSTRLNSKLRNNKQRTAAEILKEISEDVRSFIGDAKQHDDMTMVVMKCKRN